MAGTGWETSHHVGHESGAAPQGGIALRTDLLQNGHHYSFYEAVRLLHGLNKNAPKVGHQGPAEDERIRFRPALSLSFPVSDIAGVQARESADGRERLLFELTFMGLYGTSSPLPSFYTEDLLRLENEESLLRGFIDLFHHRLFSLAYRVWEKYRQTVQYDATGRDYFSSRLLMLIGASLDHLPPDESVRAGRLLAYAGLALQQPRSAASLEAVLSEHFDGAPVEIEQLKGRWCEISSREQNRLGTANCTLGRNLSLGSAVYDRAGNFGVVIGPLAFDDYMQFMPGGRDMDQARELIDLLNNDGLDYEVTAVLDGTQVKRAQLSAQHTRLGWSSWLGDASPQDQSVNFKFKGWRHGRG